MAAGGGALRRWAMGVLGGGVGRVAKCHGYGGYIRVKNWKVGVKCPEEYKVVQNQVLFWVNLSN